MLIYFIDFRFLLRLIWIIAMCKKIQPAFTGSSPKIVSYTTVVQNIEESLSLLEQGANELKSFEPPAVGIQKIIDVDLPELSRLITEFGETLLKDEYLTHTIRNFFKFSDPLKELWTKVNQMTEVSHSFFRLVSAKLTSLTLSYKVLLSAETDRITSPIIDEYLQNMTRLLGTLMQTNFPFTTETRAFTGNQISLSSLIKICQNLAIEVADKETSKQVSERVKRALENDRQNIPCTVAEEQIFQTARSKVIQWTEEVNFEIPTTLTYTVLSCYQLLATEAILQYLSFLYNNADFKKLQELQQMEMDLALTAMWIREKFVNQTIQHKKLEKDDNITGVDETSKVVAFAPLETNEIWICDPKQYIHGQNFIRFSGVFQACIVHEYHLNMHESCSGKCKHYTGIYDTEIDQVASRLLCSNPECKKEFKKMTHEQANNQCSRLEGEIRICSSQKKYKRYEWFEFGSQHYGKFSDNGSCSGELQIMEEEWRMEIGPIMQIPQLCEICMCQCNHPARGRTQISYLSVSEVICDLGKNFVVTGIRFDTKYGIIFVSIETGQLLPTGKIDQSSLQWISPQLITQEGTFDHASTLRLGSDFNKIYLDDIEGPRQGDQIPTYVLTGIRFRYHQDHLALEAQMTQIDLVTKTLNPLSTVWMNRLDDHRSRKILTFADTDEPIMSPRPSTFHSTFNQGVQFTSASLEKTAGQVVVPYFDSQSVHTVLRSPIYSIGIVHKGQSGYGGFLSFKISLL